MDVEGRHAILQPPCCTEEHAYRERVSTIFDDLAFAMHD